MSRRRVMASLLLAAALVYGGAQLALRESRSGPAVAEPSRYEVRKGDSLWTIAERVYGDGDLWTVVRDANGIGADRPLEPGMVLVIPPAR